MIERILEAEKLQDMDEMNEKFILNVKDAAVYKIGFFNYFIERVYASLGQVGSKHLSHRW